MKMRILVAALLLALAGCDGGGGASPSASPSGMSDAQIAAGLREYGACMRQNGVPSFEDPRYENGRATGGGPKDTAVDDATMGAADRACESVRRRLPDNIWRDPPVTAEDLEKLRRFAKCMRENGLPEWPDPDGDGAFLVMGTPLEGAIKSDVGQAAKRACRQHYDGDINLKGAPGGPK
jgi:hypothetical protein